MPQLCVISVSSETDLGLAESIPAPLMPSPKKQGIDPMCSQLAIQPLTSGLQKVPEAGLGSDLGQNR